MRTATRVSNQTKAPDASRQRAQIPRVVVVATVLLAVVVVSLTYAKRHHDISSRPGAARPSNADVSTPMTIAASLGAGVGHSQTTDEVSQDEFDDRIALQLCQLDVAKEQEIFHFLERNGSSPRISRPADQAKLLAALYRLRSDERPLTRAGALAALGRIPDGGFILTEAFLGSFDDPDARVRREAVIGRTRHGLENYWTFVMPLVKDEDPIVRVAVAYALGNVGEAPARTALSGMLFDRSDDVVEAAADAVGRRLEQMPTSSILEMLKSERQRVRLAGVRLLGKFRTRESMTALIPILEDPAWSLRREALRSLAGFNGEPALEARVRIEAVAFDSPRPRVEGFEALQELAHTSSEPDTNRLQSIAEKDPDPALRLAAARSLLARRVAGACPVLVALLETEISTKCDDGDRLFVRSNAAQTLRDVSGAAFRDDDARAWKKLIPGLEARVAIAEFEYQPEYLPERW